MSWIRLETTSTVVADSWREYSYTSSYFHFNCHHSLLEISIVLAVWILELSCDWSNFDCLRLYYAQMIVVATTVMSYCAVRERGAALRVLWSKLGAAYRQRIQFLLYWSVLGLRVLRVFLGMIFLFSRFGCQCLFDTTWLICWVGLGHVFPFASCRWSQLGMESLAQCYLKRMKWSLKAAIRHFMALLVSVYEF
jgi:hypothetical protein